MKLELFFKRTLLVACVAGSVASTAFAEDAADDVLAALNAEIEKVDAQQAPAPAAPAKATAPAVRKPAAGPARTQPMGPEKRQQLKNAKVIITTVTGRGKTAEAAKLDAFRKAVEGSVGIWVDTEAMRQKNEMVKDRVSSISNADIQKYETLKDPWKLESGLYAIQIKAWVEKKAIAPKFVDVFPKAFANVKDAAEVFYVKKITKEKRTSDAAALMAAEMSGVNRMRNWVRLSVAKGKGFEQVTRYRDPNNNKKFIDVGEVPGKGLYRVRYAMKVDDKAYFDGFVPHFKTVLSKMQEGEADEGAVLEAVDPQCGSRLREMDGGRKTLKVGGCQIAPADLKPFFTSSYLPNFGATFFIDPFKLTGFPGMGTQGIAGKGGNPPHFMFDKYQGVSQVQENRSYNIWLLDKLNEDRTVVQCSAYKVPKRALHAYWKAIYGDLNASYRLSEGADKIVRKIKNDMIGIEISLLDGKQKEIAIRRDRVPVAILTCGAGVGKVGDVQELWEQCNTFETFFVRPLFYSRIYNCYSAEIQRDVYFSLTDSQLEKVDRVKVRFVGGK